MSYDKIAVHSLRYDYGFLWQVLNVLGVFLFTDILTYLVCCAQHCLPLHWTVNHVLRFLFQWEFVCSQRVTVPPVSLQYLGQKCYKLG